MTPSLRTSLSSAAITLLLATAPATAHVQFRAPATVGIQAMSTTDETAPPRLLRAKFPDHRLEGAVVGGVLGVGVLWANHKFNEMNRRTGSTRLVDSPILAAVFLTGLGAFIGSTIQKQP